MAMISAPDGCRLYVEETGSGVPILFLHEFAGDHRAWEPQVRHFSRSNRCITFAARGYLPSDVPGEPERYGQEAALADAIAILDALNIEKAHIVGPFHGGLHGAACRPAPPGTLPVGLGLGLWLGFVAGRARGGAEILRCHRRAVPRHPDRRGRRRLRPLPHAQDLRGERPPRFRRVRGDAGRAFPRRFDPHHVAPAEAAADADRHGGRPERLPGRRSWCFWGTRIIPASTAASCSSGPCPPPRWR